MVKESLSHKVIGYPYINNARTCPNSSNITSKNKSQMLKDLLQDGMNKKTAFAMEAHNGLSAILVQNAGFKAIWASGLTISASLGLRDSNEASWTQILNILEYMADSTDIPILVDGDTGYGNFNNARKFVKKLYERGLAGICIEDKLFPKTNSFIGENQPLANIEEFCGKIRASKDVIGHTDFCLVARVEALIAGLGMDEALKRANAYYMAGADAILIHSKTSTADEIIEFAKYFNNTCPVIIVPTKYYLTPTEKFRQSKIAMAIWANHGLRASIKAMKEIYKQLYDEESLINVEKEVAPLNSIFELVNDAELRDAENLYLPRSKK